MNKEDENFISELRDKLITAISEDYKIPRYLLEGTEEELPENINENYKEAFKKLYIGIINNRLKHLGLQIEEIKD